MGRSFYFSQNPLARRVTQHEATADGLRLSMGVTEAQHRHARSVLSAVGATPGERTHAGGGSIVVQGEVYRVGDQRTDKDGAVEAEVYRPVGGGRFEKRTIREERAGERTWIITEV